MVRNMAFVNSIRTYSEKKLIGYTREQLFDVVAAVENYYLFVPACRRSDVVQRSPDRIKAKLEIGIPPLLEAYTSNVKLDKPRLITASCIEGHLFKHLETRWRFRLAPQPYSPTEVCLLDFYVSFEFKSLLYAKLASALFDEMVRLNSNKNIEMETICNPIQVDNNDHNNDVVADNALKKATGIKSASGANELQTLNNHQREKELATTSTTTTKSSTVEQQSHRQNDNDDQKVVNPSNQPIDSANIKIKRCKHGRIIIKDSSKKKPMQQGDFKETNPIQSRKADQVILGEDKVVKDVSSASSKKIVDKLVGYNQNLANTTTATTTCSDKTTNTIVDSPLGSDKVYGPKERDSNEVKYSSKSNFTSHSSDNNNNNSSNNSKSKILSRNTRSRRKSPPSRDRRRVSQSPSHRKSPRRHRDRSPRRRQHSKSPHRRESSREKGSWKISQEMSSNRSSTRRNRSSARQDHSPPPSSSHRRDKRSPPRSSRRRYSESSSDESRAVSPNNFGRHRGNSTRSPETRRDRYSRTTGMDISRDSIFGKSPTRTIDILDKDLSSSNADKETYTSKQMPQISGVKTPLAQQSLPTTSTQASNCPSTKTAQPEPSPERSPISEISLTPTTDGSISSDIYDPEGPIIPISPGDSPPLSPLIKAAKHSNSNNNNNNPHNHNLIGKNSTLQDNKNEKSNNEDDVPSSAVELNKKEKYLQKLNRQERVVEEIKIALKPHYQKRAISKEQYKDVLRRAVPKICHSKDGEINPVKIRIMVEAYVKKMKKKHQSR